MKIARLAEAFNLPVTSHGAHDVTVQLLAACPNRSYLEAHGFGLERYIAEPLRSRTASPWHRTGQDTASSSTGRVWTRSAHNPIAADLFGRRGLTYGSCFVGGPL